ncbi:ABC transporter permease [Flavobacterium sp. RHBU_3]|uniref:ABC transporter permease n=1 Tax=Flavobacterium sp. RHBU_3 TaxID=3391184 RepID=UPI0039846478
MFNLFRENTKIALGSIKGQALRTTLTVFIISLGIFALVVLLTVVDVLGNSLSSNFGGMGANTFSISRYDGRNRMGRQNDADARENPAITYPQAKAFKDRYNFPGIKTSLSFVAASNAEVKFGTKKSDPEITVVGADENFLPNSGLEVTQGRNFSNFDVANNSYVCIVGSDFEKGILKDVNPIGQVLSIRGAKFKVIGVLKARGSTFGNRQDLNVIVPIQLARSLFTSPSIDYTIKVGVTHQDFLDGAVGEAILAMRRVRKLPPTATENFGVERSDELLEKLKSNTDYLEGIAWGVGIITIFGSSVALMNIMLVSVSERTREIGVRKSLGAKKITIATQFFTETLVICLIGGIIGIVLGILLGFGVAKGFDIGFVMPWKATLSALGIVVVVTIFSGLLPAIKAAKLDPVEALRYE